MILHLDQDKPNQSASKHKSFDTLFTLPRLPEEGFETLQLPEITRASLGCRKDSFSEDFFSFSPGRRWCRPQSSTPLGGGTARLPRLNLSEENAILLPIVWCWWEIWGHEEEFEKVTSFLKSGLDMRSGKKSSVYTWPLVVKPSD